MPKLGRLLAALALLAAAAAFWLFLAPPQLGGGTSYAVVYGTSMEPHFHRGDLVLLRRRPSYRVGEVVGYRSVRLRRNVLHRIVAARGDRFTFKGDNNGFVDPEQPRAAQLFGEEWLRIPGAGTQLEKVRSPWNAAVLVGLAVLFLLGGGGGTVRRRGRRADEEPAAPPPRRAPPLAAVALGVGGTVLAAALVLGLAAFTRPPTRTLVSPDLYVKRGAFSYSAQVPVGAVYAEPVLRSPAPVYLKLVRRLDVAFAYSTASRAPLRLAGTGRLVAVLGDGSGWSRRLALGPSSRFAGARTTLRGRLDLARLSALVRRFEAQTGEHNSLYRLELRAHVELDGTVAGRPVHDVFAPGLTLDLDQLRLQVDRPSDGGNANSLVRAEGAQGTTREPLRLVVFGRRLEVARARALAGLGAGAGALLLLLGALPALLRRGSDETTGIARRYADWLVEISPAERPAGASRRVASMEALARLADRYERLILHERGERCDSYLVEDDGVVYRYDVPHARPRAAADDEQTLFGWRPEERPRPLAEERT